MLTLNVTPQEFQVIWNALMAAPAGSVFDVATKLKQQVVEAEATKQGEQNAN